MNRTTSPSISDLRYDVDKGINFVLEFNISPSLTSQIKVDGESKTCMYVHRHYQRYALGLGYARD